VLSAELAAGDITITQHDRHRIAYLPTASYYDVIANDADNALGENIHGCAFDEVATQSDDRLWNAVRTSMGTRPQALLIAATTAGDQPMSFALREEQHSRRVADDPLLDRRRFVWIRAAPESGELNDEQAWAAANPALGQFLSIDALRDECAEAMLDPSKAKAFRRFRLNTWQRAESRWLPAGRWRPRAQPLPIERFVGRRCHAGVDLASVSDLTALAWYFPPQGDEPAAALWRHYVPEAAVPALDRITSGLFSQWCERGWCVVTDGEVVDYEPLHADIAAGCSRFAVVDLGIDPWNSTSTTTWAQKALPKLTVALVRQSFMGLSASLKEIDRQLRAHVFDVGADPIAAWCASCAEIRQDASENIRLVKPERQTSNARIDAIAALANAVDGWLRTPEPKRPGRVAGF
jgi:phage terminase large subunit-like protein